MDELAAAVADALETDAEEFTRRARAEVEAILAEIESGTFDNPQGCVGLEYEFYAVEEPGAGVDRSGEPAALARVPRRLLEYVGFEKELGLHNAEMSTQPEPFTEQGVRAQGASVRARLSAAGEPMRASGLRLVSDGVWTRAPTGSTATEYLDASAVHDGIRLASNMSSAPRYHAMSNTGTDAMAMRVDLPHATVEADTIMPVALTTSVQPHYQLPRARELPAHFRYAVRVAGPLLALAANSPLLPADCYDDPTAESVSEDGWAAHRVPLFEGTLNPPGPDGGGYVGTPDETDVPEGPERGKVRFPRDVDSVRTALERIATDETVVPMPVSPHDRFDDDFAHFRLKHGTYWRWVRPVFGGASRTAANARIEFRPLGGQPTVRDTVALQATFAGLLVGLVRADHPVSELPWSVARRNFYAAARDGLDADLTWIDATGEETADAARLYDDLFEHAAVGLRAQGFSDGAVGEILQVLRERVDRGVTPASWKLDRMEAHLTDGASVPGAIAATHRDYVDHQRGTLLDGSFLDWLSE
ncbi:MAG: hypothetical protein ABEJ42_10230 [Halobacteriaceae archaeon]